MDPIQDLTGFLRPGGKEWKGLVENKGKHNSNEPKKKNGGFKPFDRLVSLFYVRLWC